MCVFFFVTFFFCSFSFFTLSFEIKFRFTACEHIPSNNLSIIILWTWYIYRKFVPDGLIIASHRCEVQIFTCMYQLRPLARFIYFHSQNYKRICFGSRKSSWKNRVPFGENDWGISENYARFIWFLFHIGWIASFVSFEYWVQLRQQLTQVFWGKIERCLFTIDSNRWGKRKIIPIAIKQQIECSLMQKWRRQLTWLYKSTKQ